MGKGRGERKWKNWYQNEVDEDNVETEVVYRA